MSHQPNPNRSAEPSPALPDFCSSEFVEAFLAHEDIGPVTVAFETHAGIGSWYLGWRHGSMDLQGGTELNARATAALFIYLWHLGIDCGLARDLACSYFDPRIGR